MELEDRYLVIKRKDIAPALTMDEMDHLDILCEKINLSRLQREKKLPVESIVIEKDWPEYEPTLKLLSARVDGEADAENNEVAYHRV